MVVAIDDNNNYYIDTSSNHTLIIGNTHSIKEMPTKIFISFETILIIS